MKDLKEIFLSECVTCNIHADRIEKALVEIRKITPLTPQRLEEMDTHELGMTELLTGRFSKLQDVLGEKIFPMLLTLLGENIQNKSFIDRLNMLEKLGFLEDAQHWFIYRKVRNAFTHEYPDNMALLVKNLEDVMRLSAELCAYWYDLNQKIDHLVFVDSSGIYGNGEP